MMSYSAFVCVLSRSALNTYDRHILGQKKYNLETQVAFNTICPLLLAIMGLSLLRSHSLMGIISVGFSFYCFCIAVLTHFVSLCFSYCFKHFLLKQVVLQSKLADVLTFVVYFIYSFLVTTSLENVLETKNLVFFSINALIFVFLCIFIKDDKFLRNRYSAILIVSVILQTFLLPWLKNQLYLLDEILLTVGVLFWRSIFSLAHFAWIKMKCGERDSIRHFDYFGSAYFWVMGITRSVFMLISYLSFIIAIKNENPCLTFSILNSAPLISTLLSQIILKEKVHWEYLVAIGGFTIISIYYQVN